MVTSAVGLCGIQAAHIICPQSAQRLHFAQKVDVAAKLMYKAVFTLHAYVSYEHIAGNVMLPAGVTVTHPMYAGHQPDQPVKVLKQ